MHVVVCTALVSCLLYNIFSNFKLKFMRVCILVKDSTYAQPQFQIGWDAVYVNKNRIH